MRGPLQNPVLLFLGFIAIVFIGVFIIQRTRGDDPVIAEPLADTAPRGALVGSRAPDFTLPDIAGSSFSLTDLKGKVVILNFWATWCPPCKKEIPDFIELQQRYGEKGLEIVGVALEEREPVADYVASHGVDYRILIGDGRIAQQYGGIRSIPTTFIIDREGRVAASFVGLQSKEVWLAQIEKLL